VEITPLSLLNVLGARGIIPRRFCEVDLERACADKSGEDGFITLEDFSHVMFASKEALNLRIIGCDLCTLSVGEIITKQTGIALIANNKGHVVGFDSDSRLLFDPHPGCYPIELAGPGAKRALECSLNVRPCEEVAVMLLLLEC
jgi:hypothetical protein